MIEDIEHYERMIMMASYFREHSNNDKLYILEVNASEGINRIIKNSEKLDLESAEKIVEMLDEINNHEHKNDVHWFDYTLHVKHALRLKGFADLV